ncbi:bifunctional diaminohydroxyphosphoribosylaminopyrimidine deaminase/5-amino-6-(5-phosphoribosylamino)uracil reductase RibD [Nocardioides sp.]|uniref:bifunctional diaminohydroxyphosphoribosylaminopyrimidine deaminase/5-amino-6-(5-phosphoribosylamino)uracil reductase RibD n=1 Tax=Nocardioides sp. TaxID=35761 RepID=UPI003519B489
MTDPHLLEGAADWPVPAETAAMARALALAASPGVPLGPNPRVGSVLLDDAGRTVAEGHHRGAGTAHAEADALARAGEAARGTTAVVTLEPCNHTGRTGPCARALIAAGVRRVVYATGDPHAIAAGGAATLRAAGVEVVAGLGGAQARALNRAWLHGIATGRPLVTWKFAAGLDGRSAAADGSSRWITSLAARRDVHRLRAQVDVMLVGTGTALADDPALTVRDDDGVDLAHQPLRVVMGERDLPESLRLWAPAGTDGEPGRHLRTRDPEAALATLFDLGRRHVLLEGGPALAAAFVRAGLVDEIVAYLAPVLLGAGTPAVADLGVTSIEQALRPEVTDLTVLPPAAAGEQPNVRVTATPRPAGGN